MKKTTECAAYTFSNLTDAARGNLNASEILEHCKICTNCRKWFMELEAIFNHDNPLSNEERVKFIQMLEDEEGYFDRYYGSAAMRKKLRKYINKKLLAQENRLIVGMSRFNQDIYNQLNNVVTEVNAFIKSEEQANKTIIQIDNRVKKLEYFKYATIVFAVVLLLVIAFLTVQYWPIYPNQIKIENTDTNQTVQKYEQLCTRLEIEPSNQFLTKEKQLIETDLFKFDQPSKAVDPYDQFDELFNLYLESKDPVRLDQLREIAAKMQSNGDSFGNLMISNLSDIDRKIIPAYLINRSQLIKIIDDPSVQNFTERAEILNQLNSFFINNKMHCDALRCQLALGRVFIFLNKFEAAYQNIKGAITAAHDRQIIYIEAVGEGQLGNYYGCMSAYDNAIGSLSRQIGLSISIGSDKYVASARMVLVGINANLNNNQQAFSDGMVLLRSLSADSRLLSSLYSWMAFASASQNNNYTAMLFFQHAIAAAEKTNNLYNLAALTAYSGVIKAKQNKSTEAEDLFNKAFNIADRITDVDFRNTLNVYLYGYYAKGLMLSGDSERATIFYKKAIDFYESVNERSYLIKADLYEGLSQSLLAQGKREEAKKEAALVESLRVSAQLRKENQNRFASFVAVDMPIEKY